MSMPSSTRHIHVSVGDVVVPKNHMNQIAACQLWLSLSYMRALGRARAPARALEARATVLC
jgi:hypothetical protein